MQISRHRPAIFLIAGLLAYAALFAALNLWRYYGLKSSVMDLGAFEQAFWSMLRHFWPVSTLNLGYVERPWFGFHFSPALYLLLPIYALAPRPETLLALNSLLISLTAIPIYLTARHWQLPRWLAAVWCAAFLVNPFVQGALIWDFHEMALAMPILGFALYAVVARCKRLLFLTLGLLLLCKEQMGLDVAGIGLLWMLQHGDRKTGAAIGIVGLLAFALTMLVIIPCLNRGLDVSAVGFPERFAWLVTPDLRTGQFLLGMAAMDLMYLGQLLLPFWFLPLRAIAWLLPIAGDWIVNLLDASTNMRLAFSYHSAILIMPITLAAMRAGLALAQKNPNLRLSEIALAVFALNLAFGYVSAPAPLPFAADLWELHASDKPTTLADDLAQIKAQLPPQATLLVQSNIGSFFADRANVYLFPRRLEIADAVVLYLDYPFSHSRSVFVVPFGMIRAPQYVAEVRKLLDDRHWAATYWHDHWLVLQKNAHGIAINRTEIERVLEKIQAAYTAAGPTAAE